MRKIKKIKRFVKSEEEFIKYEWHYWNTLLTAVVFLLTVNLILTGFLTDFLHSLKNYGYVGGYFAGLLFADAVTVTFSIAIFFALAEEGLNPWLITFLGAFGATSSNYLIFNFVKNKSGKNIKIHNKKYKIPKIKSKFLKKISPLIAGIIFASPLPDELVSVLFGFEHYNVKKYLLLSFIFSFLGILLIVWLGIIF